MNNAALNHQIADTLANFGLPTLPEEVVDSHRLSMDISGSIWRFNDPNSDAAFNFANRNILNPWLLYSLKRHLVHCIQRVSPRDSYLTIYNNTLFMSKAATWETLRCANTLEAHANALSRVMSETVENLRRDNLLYNFARIRGWYLWCVDHLPDLGFDADDGYKWEMIRVPGNEKGVAVRTDDPEGGSLNDVELILLRRALQADRSMAHEHIQQRAAVWLALVYGRNPANFVQLRRGDLVQLLPEGSDALWTLNIPRIKKRGRARTQFKNEYVDPTLAAVINELIESGPPCTGIVPAERPLFVRTHPRVKLIGTVMSEWAWHLTSSEFTALIRAAVDRYSIISPRTRKPLFLTTRRLRYTFATNRVREGISARELAEALDHSDLQNVQVYFDTRSTVVERLDRAAAKAIAPLLNLFKGSIVKNASEAVNGGDSAKRIRIIPEQLTPDHHLNDLGACGKREFCNLYPPYSCYPCGKFQPFSDSLEVHELVFDFLIDRRERLRSDPLESSRIAVQLDEVIYACAAVVTNMQARTNGHDRAQ